ncbi:hypothetical protein BGW38_006979 [Lunasporangiospora selenospora]|uniref:Glutathione S-transferase n=1 Tax=Lunasporangiospora selenospora TaxID=979761 RepID=A0A9P6FZH2_9FUNG|nr:hypothetical protein BGW38_006979 [Lunasporangiospora selenospora]
MTTPATRFSDEKFSSADISKSLENKTTGATTYKLEYFEVSGVGAISRDLLSYGGAKWENILVKELPNNTGSPFSVYPALHVRTGDGVEIHLAETSVIEQYLAREFGLFGDNEWEELQIKMFHSNTLMFRDRLFMRVVWNFKDKMETALETFLTQSLPQWINAHVFHLRNNGSNGHYVGNKLSLADILTANTIDFIKCLYGNEKILAMIEKCPEIMKVKENVDREPRLQTWRQSEEYKSIAENTRKLYANTGI